MSVGFVVNPAISGRAASSRMPSRSAPSAKIFTRRSPYSVILYLSHVALEAANPRHGLEQASDDEVGAHCRRLVIMTFDEDRANPGAPSGFDVPPPVAHAHAGRQIEVEPASGVEKHARLRLAAAASVVVVVRHT